MSRDASNVNFDSPLLICDDEYSPASEKINIYDFFNSKKKECLFEFQFSREFVDKELLQIQEILTSFNRLIFEEVKYKFNNHYRPNFFDKAK